ncbi:MAG: helix-turn-helix domain-containing protein [Brevundimonas sp.]
MIDLIVQAFRSEQIKTSTHLVVMLAIARRCGDENGVCFAKQATLAKDTRLHEKSVARTLAELEGASPPLIKRVKQPVQTDGRRIPDHIQICLKSVMLPEIGAAETGNAARKPGNAGLPTTPHTTPHPPRTGLHKKKPSEETLEEREARETRELSQMKEQGVDVNMAVEMIWRAVGERGRKRSTKPKVKNALVASLRRKRKDESLEERMKRILLGIRGYLASDDATKQDGAFEHGAHRTIEGDAWESYVDDGAATMRTIVPQLEGQASGPSEEVQRYWMENDRQGLPWHADRGPRPGMPGCQVSPDILAEFGYGAAAVAAQRAIEQAADDDAAAFA